MPKPFQFRLQRLLDQRELQVARARRELALKVQEQAASEGVLEEATRRVTEANQAIKGWEDHIRYLSRQAFSRGGDWEATTGYGRRMAQNARLTELAKNLERQKAEQGVRGARQQVEFARTALQKALLAQRQCEALRDYDKAVFRKEQELKEMAELAEVGSAMHYLNRVAEENSRPGTEEEGGPDE